MNNPKIHTTSIIIPAKDEAFNIALALQSIARQSVKPLEVVVANSPRTSDNTDVVASHYGSRVVTGGMPATGRNNGAKYAHGELLLFLDADCQLPNKDYLADAIDEFNTRNLDIAGTTQSPNPWSFRDALSYGIANNTFRIAQYSSSPFMQQGMFVRRNVFDNLNGFNERIWAEDSDLASRAKGNGYKFRILSSVPPILSSTRRWQERGRINYMWEAWKFNKIKNSGRDVPIEMYFDGKCPSFFDVITGKNLPPKN